MKQATGWYFAQANNCLGYGDGRKIEIGITHTVVGDIVPCKNGLHLSKEPLHALQYASGPIIYKVCGSGIIMPHGDPVDKYACSHRKYLSGGVDATEALRQFARQCALDVIHLWDAPDVVRQYLETGDEKLRAEARAAAWDEAWDAAWDAARDAAWAAAWEDAARDAARDAAWAAQNKRLKKLLISIL